MRLRGFLAILLLTFFAMSAVGAAWVGAQQWRERARTIAATQQMELATALYRLSNALTAERTFSVIRTSVPMAAPPTQLRELEGFGRGTDAALATVLAAFTRLDEPGLAAHRNRLGALAPRFAAIRPVVLEAAARPAAERRFPDALRPGPIYTAITNETDAAMDAVHALTQANSASLGTKLLVARLAWDLRGAATRAIVPISTAIRSGRAMTPAEIETTLQGQAEKDATWQRLRAVVGLLGTPPRLGAALADVQARFIDGTEREVAALFAAGRAGAEYPMTVENYAVFGPRSVTIPVVLRDAALEEARAVAAAAQQSATQRLVIVFVIILLFAAVMGLGAWLVLRRVVRPVEALTATVERLAQGDHGTEVPGRERRDEIGSMAQALEVLRRNALAARDVADAAAAEQAEKITRAERSQSLLRGFEAEASVVLTALDDAAAPLGETADLLQRSAASSQSSAENISEAASTAARHVEDVATASEQLVASIAEVARQVSSSAVLASRAAESARAGDGVVTGLAEVTDRIGQVTGMIASIASQTNLLALNATIEAARAGDAGKGFAVVAGEVKTLASQTAKATDEIASQIQAMQAETRRAVETIRGIGSAVEELSAIAARVAEAAEEQAVAAREIGRAVIAASASTAAVTAQTGGMIAEAGATTSASLALQEVSQRLSREAEALRGQVGGFLGALRAG